MAILPNCNSQKDIILTSKIVDTKTKEGLPFAHVLIRGKTHGAVTDETGKFKLSVTKFDTLQVSMLGYQRRIVSVNNIRLPIELSPVSHQLEEAVIISKYQTFNYGGVKPRKKVIYVEEGEMQGTEIGTEILDIPTSSYVDGIQFFLRSNRCDSILFRLRLYEHDVDEVANIGRNLINKDITFMVDNSKKWIRIPLSAHQIFLRSKAVIVTIEALRTWGNKTEKPDFTIPYDKKVKGFGKFRKYSSDQGWGGYSYKGRGLSFFLELRS